MNDYWHNVLVAALWIVSGSGILSGICLADYYAQEKETYPTWLVVFVHIYTPLIIIFVWPLLYTTVEGG